LNATLVLVVVTAVLGPVLTGRAVIRLRGEPPGGAAVPGPEAPALVQS
jgi:hypothetical protein